METCEENQRSIPGGSVQDTTKEELLCKATRIPCVNYLSGSFAGVGNRAFMALIQIYVPGFGMLGMKKNFAFLFSSVNHTVFHNYGLVFSSGGWERHKIFYLYAFSR